MGHSGNQNNRNDLDVAILGGGFAGVYCARTFRAALGASSSVRIGLISDDNHMVFQPMLPEVVGASLSPRHVVNPLRLLCRNVDVLRGEVRAIDLSAKQLVLDAGDFAGEVGVHFDHLALALGAKVDLSRVPGMPEHAFLLRNVGDAMLLRSTIIDRVEEANLEHRRAIKRRLLSFVVVGGGFSGVETTGQILDLFHGIARFYANVSFEEFAVTLIHSGEHLLPTLNHRLGRYSARHLERRGVRLLLDERVRSVTAGGVHLESGGTVETNTVISTIGNSPHPMVRALCETHGLRMDRGRIVTDATCRVPDHTHLWAAGDCAAVPYVGGGWCPGTAQFALRQGRLLGGNLAKHIRGRSLRTFRFRGLGQMASIGHRRAVGTIRGFSFSGFFAWWLWRTVYLGKLPGLDRKVRVMIDWTLDLFFPRDINLLSPRYSRLLKEMYLEAGGTLFRHGEPAFSLYVVKSGRIEIGDNQGVVHVAEAGEYFGERALLEDRVWRYDARASEPSILISIPAAVFHQIVQGAGSLSRLFRKSAAVYHSREMIQRLTERLPPEVLARPARDLMQRDLVVLEQSMSLQDAVTVLQAKPHSAYPVLGASGQLQGVATREDFYEFLKSGRDLSQTTLAELPLTRLPTVSPESRLSEVMERILRDGGSKALVLDPRGLLLGMITLMDFIAEQTRLRASG